MKFEILLQPKVPKSRIARSTLYHELASGSMEQLDSRLRPYKRYFHAQGNACMRVTEKNSRPSLKLAKAHDFIA